MAVNAGFCYSTRVCGTNKPRRARDSATSIEVGERCIIRDNRLIIMVSLLACSDNFPDSYCSHSIKSGATDRSSSASSSGMFELEKKPLPSSNPAICPAPKRGVIRMCHRKNEDEHNAA